MGRRNEGPYIGKVCADTTAQVFQAVQPEDYAARVDLYHWISEGLQNVEYSFLCDEAQFTRYDTIHCHISHVRCCNIADQFHCKLLPTSLFGERVV